MKTWKYRITFYTHKETVIITSPISCRGTITKNPFSSSVNAELEIYNLALSTRNKIYQAPLLPYDKRNLIRIEAGYSEDEGMSELFFGIVNQSYSARRGGATEVTSKISALCMDLFNDSSVTFQAGTSKRDAIKNLANNMPNLTLNSLGNVSGNFQTTTTFDGNTLEQINKIAGGSAFIDNGNLNVCLLNEVVDAPVPVIAYDNYLLETPIRKNATIEANFIMLPSLLLGQLLEIQSVVHPDFNGQYKVLGFTHNFLFSESVAGQKTTKATLMIPDLSPFTDMAVSDGNQSSGLVKVKKEQLIPLTASRKATVQEILNYIKKNNGKIPDEYIIKGQKNSGLSMKWSDFLGHDNLPQERVSELNIEILSNIYVLAINAFKILSNYYSGKKIKITSGWRSVRNNKKSGGASDSKHLSGLAMDFCIEGVNVSSTGNIMKQAWSWGFSYNMASKGFVHIQISSTKGLVNDV